MGPGPKNDLFSAEFLAYPDENALESLEVPRFEFFFNLLIDSLDR